LLLSACGKFDMFGQEREPWRDAAEERCLRAGELTPSAFAEPLPPIRQKYSCGLEHPFKVAALGEGEVSIQPPARLGCPMNSALNRWLRDVVQPAAYSNFGQPVVGLKNIASYGCRTRNNKRGEKLSEHSFGNALDIKAFYLADGREVPVYGGWKGSPDQRAFLRHVHAGACGTFKTVLGPGSDGFHEDHFHVDLARHNANGTAYCRPLPRNIESAPQHYYQPQPPAYYPPQDPYAPGAQNGGQPVYPGQEPYGANVPMSYATPRWPVARVPTPYAGNSAEPGADALDR
jgi:hypothetical protein